MLSSKTKTKQAAAHGGGVRAALKRAEEVCARDNLRLTRIRRRVLELIWKTRRAAKAYELLEKMDGNPGFAAPPTVYRALNFLLKNGFIHKINARNAYVGCAHPPRRSPHSCILTHCVGCGKVGECCDDKTAASIARLARRNGFQPTGAALEIEGKCGACANTT